MVIDNDPDAYIPKLVADRSYRQFTLNQVIDYTDLLQQAYLIYYECKLKFVDKGTAKFSGYAYQSIKFRLWDYIKENCCSIRTPVQAKPKLFVPFDELEDEYFKGMSDFSKHMAAEFTGTLSDKERNILDLKVQGYNNIEIGEMFGISHQAIAKTIKNIRVKWNTYDNQ